LILSGELVDARTAQNIGMIDEVVADEALLAHVQATAERYLTVPWLSVLRSKQLTNQAFDHPYEAALSIYFTAQAEAMQSTDHLAAMQAYQAEQANKHQSAAEKK
jgi:enoyl-CoA hydratase/carnithine racemase